MKKVKLLEYHFCATFIKRYFHSSTVLECSLNRFKTPEIIKNEIEPFFPNKIREKLRIIDEATDK